jgi:ketosteroid isomerase-like protein
MRLSCSEIALALALLLSAAANSLSPAPAPAAEAEQAPETAIRDALEKWTADFNAGHEEKICDLFALDLRYDYRGHPERGYGDICTLLHRSLADRTKHYAYFFTIKEILMAGDLAIVRLSWTLRVGLRDPDGFGQSTESGMDIFRKQTDGSWKIIRYIAYEE